MCFEILGFDIIFDNKLKPYLLEINHAPSFNIDSPLDELIKTNVLTDTFSILYKVGPKAKKLYKNYRNELLKLKIWRVKSKKEDMYKTKKKLIEQKDAYMLENSGAYNLI